MCLRLFQQTISSVCNVRSTSFYSFIPILAYVYASHEIRIAAGVKGSAHLVSQDLRRMGWRKPAPQRSHFCRTDMSFMSEASWEHSYVPLLLCLRTEPQIKNGTKIPPENIFVANSCLFYHSRALCNKANLLLNGQKPSSHWKIGEKIEKSRNRHVEKQCHKFGLTTALIRHRCTALRTWL